MMDLKDIIKWFIPCLRAFLVKSTKMSVFILFVLFFSCHTYAAKIHSDSDIDLINTSINKSVTKYLDVVRNNESYATDLNGFPDSELSNSSRSLREDSSVGRTFGRPFKKMMQALVPVVFQVGAASTWAVVAALVGIKTLVVALIILKLLLVAGAAKIGALLASKPQYPQKWEPPQKEIHLHIHNGHHNGEEHISPWNREGLENGADTKHLNVYDPYSGGPQTISTPYGNYMKIDPNNHGTHS